MGALVCVRPRSRRRSRAFLVLRVIMATGEMKDLVQTTIDATCNDTKLHTALKKVLLEYFTNVVPVEDEGDLPMDGLEWVQAAGDAWKSVKGEEIPTLFKSRHEKWAGVASVAGSLSPGGVPGSLGTLAGGGIASSSTLGAHTALVSTLTSGDDALLDGIEVGPTDKVKALDDIKKQGITGARMLAFSGSIELGQVLPVIEVTAGRFVYGGNPRLTDKVKASRKAGIDTLGEIIKAKDKLRFNSHINGLLRELGEKNLVQECTLLSRWLTETMAHFDSNLPAMWAYLEEFFKTYAGRGIPCHFDTSIAWRVTMSNKSGSGDSEEVKRAAKEAKEAREETSKLRSEAKSAAADVKAMRNELNQLKGKVNKEQGPPSKSGDYQASVTCHKCGKKGHFARDCPTNKKEEDEPEE